MINRGSSEAMVLNRDENVYCNSKFDDRCLMEECSNWERMNFVDSDGSESDEGCDDIVDKLPKDPFNMEINIALPKEPSSMDFNIRLPKDPFGMDNIEATFAAITGLMEDLGLKAFEPDESSEDNSKDNDDNTYFTELNVIWASYEEEGDNEVSIDGDEEDLMCFGSEIYQSEHLKKDCDDAGVGAPADALFFALGYLGVKDLLSIERVCKPFCDAVQNDPLLWRNIHIDYPLSNIITDDDLLRLTNRAQGKLCSLSLVKCLKITNTGLKNVLESNPGLTKLSVPGCIKLNPETILHDLKAFNSIALHGIKRLRIGELLGLTNQLFKEFNLLLGAAEEENNRKPANHKPRYCRTGQLHLSLEDERTIDIEMCPECQLARPVYDCPTDSCQLNNTHSTKTCRGCSICIPRCMSCGCCLGNKPYEETFCLDSLCFDCMAGLFNCQESGTVTVATWRVTAVSSTAK